MNIQPAKAKVLLIDDNNSSIIESLEGLNNSKTLQIELIKTQGVEAINKITNELPDLVVMELVLNGIDGLHVIEEIKKRNLNKNIKFIVTSSLSAEGFIKKAGEIGVTYYMVKPCDTEILFERMEEVLGFSSENKRGFKGFINSKRGNDRGIEEKISNVFYTCGIPAHIKGYQFLREAIKMTIEDPDVINSITKKLYPNIAEKFETSASKVERAIRHAIEVAWNRGKIENINTLFGVKVYTSNEKPTNGEFIALVADKMLLEGI